MNSLLERGTFVLSIDNELDEGSARYSICRKVVDALLELMERFDIHATWAVLGYQFPGQSYYNYDDGNVVQQILHCKVHQEIGSHTFSHIRVGDPNCTQERFESELLAFQAAAKVVGVNLSSFVFPWNSVGYLDSLYKYGYIAYRGPSADWFAELPASLRRLAHLLYHWFFIPVPPTVATYEQSIWNLPASYYYVCGAGWGKMIPISLRIHKVKKGLSLAARERGLFHLWLHPFNLVNNQHVWLKGLEIIFAEIRRYREEGLLENLTMGELARTLETQNKQEVPTS